MGGIGFFSFPVLVIFEIGFSVFALIFDIHCGFRFFPFLIFCFRFFLIRKAVYRFLLFACLIPRPHHFTSVNPFWVTSTGDVIGALLMNTLTTRRVMSGLSTYLTSVRHT